MNQESEIHCTQDKQKQSQICSDNRSPENPDDKSVLEVKWAYRWEVFRRLKSLGINCQCSTNEPLLVLLDTPVTAMQIWSVLKQKSASRQELINWLDDCWQVEYKQRDK